MTRLGTHRTVRQALWAALLATFFVLVG